MKVTSLKIPEVKLLEPNVIEDERGCFFESFNQKKFNELVKPGINFVQDNHSISRKGVLRGLHYQKPPFAQGKLVRVILGEVFDVAVDLRKSSSTFGKWVGEIISSNSKKQLWIPEGFAHGFLVLSDVAEVVYKTTEPYSKDHEKVISYNDKRFNVVWPEQAMEVILSQKDKPIS
jgi:dTDP-4-dehydrorhamnose 3,5-epimerase